jgi:zinc protease
VSNELHLTSIDGVPVVWTPSNEPTLEAWLSFRVGMADEAFVQRGLSHLIEHLALAGIPDRLNPTNGSTAPTITNFVTAGTPAEVASFVTDIARSLARLPYERLDREVGVLRTEGANRTGSLTGSLLGLMCGNQRYGLLYAWELGLEAVVPSTVEAWRRRYFTRGNAVLVLSGPPPHGIDLSALPDGPRMPAPPLTLIEPVPTWVTHGSSGGIVLCAAVPEHAITHVGAFVLGKRLQQRLREHEGRAYSASVDVNVWVPGEALVVVSADCTHENSAAVQQAIQVEISRLAIEGATLDEVRELHARHDRFRQDVRCAKGFLKPSEMRVACGLPIEQPGQFFAAARGVSPSDVSRFAEFLLQRAMWSLPPNVGPDRRYQPLRQWSDAAVTGREYPSVAPPGTYEATHKLVVGSDGISLLVADGKAVTCPFADVAALVQYSNGARRIFGRDGFAIAVHPDDWRNGSRVTAALDAAVAAELRVPTSRALPRIEPRPAQTPAAAPAAEPSRFAKLRKR